MITRIQRRRIARRIVAAGLAIGTGVGIAVVDVTAAASGAPVCLADGPVTYRPSPGQAPITVPACPRKAPPPTTCAEVVGSDGYSHPLGQPDVKIPKCQPAAAKPATPKVAKLARTEKPAKRWCEIRKTCTGPAQKTSHGTGGVPAGAGSRERQAAAETAAREQRMAQQAREREQRMERR